MWHALLSKLIQHLKYCECKEKKYSVQMKIMWCNVLVYFHMMHMYSCCFAPPLRHYFPNQSGDLKSTLSQTWFLKKLQETHVSRVKTHGFLQHFHRFALNQLTFRLLFPGVRHGSTRIFRHNSRGGGSWVFVALTLRSAAECLRSKLWSGGPWAVFLESCLLKGLKISEPKTSDFSFLERFFCFCYNML